MTVKVLRKKKSIQVPIGVECTLEDLLAGLENLSFDLQIEETGQYYGNLAEDTFHYFNKTGNKLKASDIKLKIYPVEGQIAESFNNIE